MNLFCVWSIRNQSIEREREKKADVNSKYDTLNSTRENHRSVVQNFAIKNPKRNKEEETRSALSVHTKRSFVPRSEEEEATFPLESSKFESGRLRGGDALCEDV